MRRRTFDLLASCIGALLTIVLFVAGGLLLWGYSYVTSSVHDQLAAQKIYFPPASAFKNPQPGTEITPSMIPSVSQYAGQQLLTGQQAEAYANNFINVHLNEIGGGKTYSELSAQLQSMQSGTPAYTALSNQVDLIFRGTTLRGLLLEAYGFGTMGQIALIAAICSFVLGFFMLLLTLFGFLHYRKVDEKTELLSRSSGSSPDSSEKREPALV